MKIVKHITFLFWVPLAFYPAAAAAQCSTAPTCESLGYKMTEAQCSGKKYVACPMDLEKIFCSSGLIGEVKPFAGTDLPKGWLKANGASLSSAKYPELYAVIGTTYGGSGSMFYLPNLTAKMVVGAASSNYATNRLGATGGAEKVTLSVSELPMHTHGYTGRNGNGWPKKPSDSTEVGSPRAYPRQTQTAYRGSGLSHNNMPPYLAVDYIIYTGVHEGEQP